MQSHPRGPRGSAGFSLTEMLMVVTIIGIVMLLAIPRVERSLNRRDVISARVGIAGMIMRARSAAIQTRRPLTLSITSGTAVISGASGTMFGGASMVMNLSQNFGVTVTPSAGTLSVLATGLITGTPYSVVISKGSWSDTLNVTGFGRVE